MVDVFSGGSEVFGEMREGVGREGLVIDEVEGRVR